ncbi:hypothetical protein KM043_004014 [Ampulex compressa]|nr:hypothetical protein KM043_004014 [Ampulex compressa]
MRGNASDESGSSGGRYFGVLASNARHRFAAFFFPARFSEEILSLTRAAKAQWKMGAWKFYFSSYSTPFSEIPPPRFGPPPLYTFFSLLRRLSRQFQFVVILATSSGDTRFGKKLFLAVGRLTFDSAFCELRVSGVSSETELTRPGSIGGFVILRALPGRVERVRREEDGRRVAGHLLELRVWVVVLNFTLLKASTNGATRERKATPRPHPPELYKDLNNFEWSTVMCAAQWHRRIFYDWLLRAKADLH